MDANNVREALGEGETPASVSYTYTAQDKLKTQTDREGKTTSYTYDKDGSVRTLTGPRGNSGNYDAEDFTLTYRYDDLKRLVRAELPPKETGQQDVEIGFAYDKRGNLLSRTEPDGGKTIYTYTARNQVETETLAGGGTEYTTAYTYDRAGNLKTITDPRGKTTEHDYDDLNRVVKTTFPLGNDVQYEYDEDNNRTAETDGEGNRTDYTYDLYKRMRQVKTPGADNPAVTGYDRLGNITGTTNTLGHTRTYAYDNRSRLTTETDELGNDYTFTYDNEGNILTTTDPNGTYSEYSYTDNYKIKTITMANTALGKTKTINYRYDEAGAIIWTNDDGVTTSCNGYDPDDPDAYTPDPYDRILEQTTKVGNRIFTTNYNYDIMDRITGLTYPNEKTVTYTYNKLGEITGMPGYLDGAPTYEDGLLKTYTASNNNTTTFDYDDNGRLSSLSHTNTEEIKSYAFTYDNADNIIQRNGDHYDYDEENRLTNAYLNGSFQADVEDDEQTVGVIREDMKGGKQLEFNLEFVLDDPEIVELDYAAGSIGVDLEGLYEVTRIELKAENPDNRVIPEAIRVFASETALEDYEEISDFTARFEEKDGETVIAIKLLPPVTARLIKVKTNFDDRNADFSWRDKAEFRNGVDEIIKVYYNVEQRDEAYTYDDLGNRVEETITLDGTKTKTTKYYPQCSRLMTNGKYVYTYDANGNITGKGTHVAIEGSTVKVNEVETAYWESVTSSIDGITIAEEGQWWEYEYDLLNRMVEVSKNGETKATYSYNEAGLMVKKVGSRGTIYSTYSQNGKLLYEEYEDTETYRQYVYAFGRQFAREEGTIEETETVPVYTATDRIYYSTDHLGSVTAVTDETGDVLWKNDYTPFGELADPENTFDGAQVYAGHFWDEDAELYYAKARWYDAETGRFTTVDPVKDGVNWYVYCGGNPIGYYDYYGLWPTAPPVGDVTLDGVTVENERSHIPLGSDGDKSLGWAQHGVTVNGVENFVGPAQTHEDSNPKPNIPQGDAYPEIGPKPKNYYDQLQPDFSFSPLKPQYNPNLFLETPDNLKYEPDLFLDELAFYCNRFAWNVAILRGVNPGFRSWCRIGQEYRFGGSVTDNPTEDTAGWIVYIGQDKKGNEYIGHITYYECHSGDSSYYVWETTGYNIPVPVEYDIGKDPAKYNIYKDVKFITLGKAPNIPVADFKYTYDHDIINLDWSARKSRRNDYRTPHLLKDSKLLEKYPRLKKHLPKEKKDER